MPFDIREHYLVIKWSATLAMDVLVPGRHEKWRLVDIRNVLLPVILEGQVVRSRVRTWGMTEDVLIRFRTHPGRTFKLRLAYPNEGDKPMRSRLTDRQVVFVESVREVMGAAEVAGREKVA